MTETVKINNPFFSLIIPVYKTEAFLEECFRSLLCQTFINFEAIIIDDGSPKQDAFLCPAEQFNNVFGSDKRFVFLKQENKGVSIARNIGIGNSNGKFIKFIDSDDVLKPDYLENIYSQLLKQKEYWDNSIYYVEPMIRFTIDKEGERKILPQEELRYKNNFRKELIYFNIPCPKLLLTKEVIGATRFTEGVGLREETDFYLRVFLDNRIKKTEIGFIQIEEDGYIYRTHEQSFTKYNETRFDKSAAELYEKLLYSYNNVLNTREKILCRLGIKRYLLADKKTGLHNFIKKVLGLIAKLIGGWYW